MMIMKIVRVHTKANVEASDTGGEDLPEGRDLAALGQSQWALKFNGHDNSHPLEPRVCLSQTL